jgi:hypothetical protein
MNIWKEDDSYRGSMACLSQMGDRLLNQLEESWRGLMAKDLGAEVIHLWTIVHESTLLVRAGLPKIPKAGKT